MKEINLIILTAAGIFVFGSWAGFTSSSTPRFTVTNHTVTVNSTGDLVDGIPGDGFCDALPAIQGDQCTLRAAIEELNAQGAAGTPHRIEFDIPGTGPFTISPGSEFPPISVPVEIDGATQPGATCPTSNKPANLMIILDGRNTGIAADGLTLGTGSNESAIRGLVIVNFNFGIDLRSSENTVHCTHLGLGIDGSTARGNNLGIYVLGISNNIGGLSSPDQRNVISGNIDSGISVLGHANSIAGNFIGTTSNGMVALGNGAGISIRGSYNSIHHNLISGNGEGIIFGSSVSNHNSIQNNIIGIARDSVTPLPNSGHGILFEPWAVGTVVGGDADHANWIAFNGGDGIRMQGVCCLSLNQIRQNAIFANGGLGIDLGGDGPDTNDSGDSDSGENERQNYTVLTSTANGWIIDVVLGSKPNSDYIVDFYRNESCDPSGYGEGEQYLHTVQVTSDSSGQAAFNIDLEGIVSMGDGITATATDLIGNTSEFSNCLTLTEPENANAVFLSLVTR